MPAPVFSAGAYFPGLALIGRFDYAFPTFNHDNGAYSCERPVGAAISCVSHSGLSESDGPVDLLALVINGGTDTLDESFADLIVLHWVLNSGLSAGRVGCAVSSDVPPVVICGPQTSAEITGTASSDSFEDVVGTAAVIIGGETHSLSKNEWAERDSAATPPALNPVMTGPDAPSSWQDFARSAVRIEDVASASYLIAGDGHSMAGSVSLSVFAYNYIDSVPETSDNYYMVT